MPLPAVIDRYFLKHHLHWPPPLILIVYSRPDGGNNQRRECWPWKGGEGVAHTFNCAPVCRHASCWCICFISTVIKCNATANQCTPGFLCNPTITGQLGHDNQDMMWRAQHQVGSTIKYYRCARAGPSTRQAGSGNSPSKTGWAGPGPKWTGRSGPKHIYMLVWSAISYQFIY